jgi:hypothetical protein
MAQCTKSLRDSRCAGSPNASAATGGEIVDSVRVALS